MCFRGRHITFVAAMRRSLLLLFLLPVPCQHQQLLHISDEHPFLNTIVLINCIMFFMILFTVRILRSFDPVTRSPRTFTIFLGIHPTVTQLIGALLGFIVYKLSNYF